MVKKSQKMKNPINGEIILYQSPDGEAELDVRLKGETLWFNLNQLSRLFERDKSVISRHLGNVYKTGELNNEVTVAFFATVQDEGGRQVERHIKCFNLDQVDRQFDQQPELSHWRGSMSSCDMGIKTKQTGNVTRPRFRHAGNGVLSDN